MTVNIFVLIFMRRYQRYGCDASEMQILWQSTSQSNVIITHLKWFWMLPNSIGFNGDGTNKSMCSIFLLAYILWDFKMITINCLGHFLKLGLISLIMFIFSCSGWHCCWIGHRLSMVWGVDCLVLHVFFCMSSVRAGLKLFIFLGWGVHTSDMKCVVFIVTWKDLELLLVTHNKLIIMEGTSLWWIRLVLIWGVKKKSVYELGLSVVPKNVQILFHIKYIQQWCK